MAVLRRPPSFALANGFFKPPLATKDHIRQVGPVTAKWPTGQVQDEAYALHGTDGSNEIRAFERPNALQQRSHELGSGIPSTHSEIRVSCHTPRIGVRDDLAEHQPLTPRPASTSAFQLMRHLRKDPLAGWQSGRPYYLRGISKVACPTDLRIFT